MPTRAARRPEAPSGSTEASVVQQVLAERRELMVANERLRLELEELRSRGERPDPRLQVLQEENRALREEVAALRAEIETYEDELLDLLEEMKKASQ
jgi:predicted RNase H-like nuclease (RuvC/YqgF family)